MCTDHPKCTCIKVFAKLFIDDDKRFFRFEWSNGTKYTYIKLDNWFE